MSDPSWAPVNETHSQIWLEQVLIDSASIEFVAYGVHATLFFLTANLLWEKRRTQARHSYAMLAYITLVFILSSIGAGTAMHTNEQAFVDDRNYPGGPGAFDIEQNSLTIDIVGTGAYMVNAWLASGLLLWRYSLFTGRRWWAIAIPACVYAVAIAAGSILLAELAKPGALFFSKSTANFALLFWGADIATTILLTVVIVCRLMYMRWKLRRILDKEGISPYVSVSAMLLESAFLYSAWGIPFIVTYAKNLSVNQLFFQPMGQIQSIAPLLIILRVAQGRAMTREKLEETGTTIYFNNTSTGMQFATRSQASLPVTSVTVGFSTVVSADQEKASSSSTLGRQHQHALRYV